MWLVPSQIPALSFIQLRKQYLFDFLDTNKQVLWLFGEAGAKVKNKNLKRSILNWVLYMFSF